MRVFLPDDMRAIDEYMINVKKISGLVLMENAAFGISSFIRKHFDAGRRIVSVCGTGNNGGDGFAAARQLIANGYTVKTVLLGKAEAIKGDARLNAGYFLAEGTLIEMENEGQIEEAFKDLNRNDVVIDAVFGTGLKRPVTGIYKTALQRMQESGAYLVSADIPSGIDAATGQVLGYAIRADHTVTFQYAKPGHFIYPGREYAGIPEVIKIGGDFGGPALEKYNWRAYPSDTEEIKLPKRKRNTHKGSYGHAAIFAGGAGFTGAGFLCVCAALKSGAGLVTAGIPQSLAEVYQAKLNEAMTFPICDRDGRFFEGSIDGVKALLQGKDAFAAGPGLTVHEDMMPLIKTLVSTFDLKKVFDADALNLIAKDVNLLRKSRGDILLTPHPKEFSRLTGLSTEQILENPVHTACAFAKEYNVTLLLKGATTIIACPNGRVSFILAGSAGMAKGGSGDVLTGVIVSLLAQGFPAFEAAVAGAHICGLAGEAAAAQNGEYTMTAMDTVRHLKDAFKKITLQ